VQHFCGDAYNTPSGNPPAGLVTTVAGLAGVTGTNNGTGSDARFYYPTSVAVDGSNNINRGGCVQPRHPKNLSGGRW